MWPLDMVPFELIFVSIVNDVTLIFDLTVNVPWLTLLELLYWNLLPATNPWGIALENVPIPPAAVKSAWMEEPTINAYWSAVGLVSPAAVSMPTTFFAPTDVIL